MVWTSWKLTASRVPTHRGCCSWGTAAARHQGSSREAPDLKGCGGGCCHCWISGRGGHHGPRFSSQHSGDNSNGAQRLGLLTSAIQHRRTNSISHKHIPTYLLYIYTHAESHKRIQTNVYKIYCLFTHLLVVNTHTQRHRKLCRRLSYITLLNYTKPKCIFTTKTLMK